MLSTMRIGSYEVLGELGRGGMGVVYRVRTPGGVDAALKLLQGVDREAFARFERERRLLASLGEAQGFVGFIDAGASSEGLWLVMPFVPGGTLRRRLDAGPLGVEETVSLGIALARALGAAHERGIVHRDVKPENVLYTASGRPLLADLGLAKHFDPLAKGASQSASLTREGAFKGTAGYMAPEQIEDAGRVGPTSDVFALGAVLYECLAGRPAFPGSSVVEVCAALSAGKVDPIGRPGLPGWLDVVVRRALELDPRARFADGGALARALQGGKVTDARSRPVVPLVVGAVLGGGLVTALALAVSSRPVALAPGGPVALAPARPVAPSRPAPAPPAPDSPARAEARRLAELGNEKGRAGDFQGAIGDCSRAIEVDPTFARAWASRGDARGAMGDADGAFADCSRAIELDPRLAAAWATRSVARGVKGDFEGELADATRAIELDSGVASSWANRGNARGRHGDLEGAIADCTKAIELEPDAARAWLCRGVARGLSGDVDGEIEDETRSLGLAPGFAEAWACRGAARGRKEDLDGAIADTTRAIELAPGLGNAWTNRGLCRYMKEDFLGAIPDLERSLELEPGGPKAAEVRQALEESRQRAR